MRRERGFTLVELLITMTIVGITLGLLSSSLRFSVRTSDVIEARLSHAEALQMAHRIARVQLERAVPLPVVVDDQVQDIEFNGTRDAVQFVTSLQGEGAPAGYVDAELRVVRDDTSGERHYSIVATYAQRSPDGTDSGSRISRVLVGSLTRAELSYFGQRAGAPGAWHDEWRRRGTLPGLVRIRMSDVPGGEFNLPDLVAAPQLAVASWKDNP